MKKVFPALIFLSGLFLIPFSICAQEEIPEINIEESAEVYLEQYSDEFQEKFFEALKQKGIENHDKAINIFLECKRLDPMNMVVDHELAKAYFEDKQYIRAQEFAIEALLSEPENLWYLNTLVSILQKQGVSVDEVSTKIPFENSRLKQNLALIYYKSENYRRALAVLKDIAPSSFTKELSAKINDSIQSHEEENEVYSFTMTNERDSDPLEDYKMRIEGFIKSDSIPVLEMVSAEALETYPSQPFFYFAQGYALNKKAKHREAIEVLEAALDYMLDDIALSNKIYKELVEAYTAINNASKANMYLRKIKPGF